MAAKKAGKSGAKPNTAFNKEFTPSEELAAIIGSKPIARPQIIKKLWKYFKDNKLQAGQLINMDDKMKAVYGNKKNRTVTKRKVAVRGDQIHMTEVSEAFKHLS